MRTFLRSKLGSRIGLLLAAPLALSSFLLASCETGAPSASDPGQTSGETGKVAFRLSPEACIKLDSTSDSLRVIVRNIEGWVEAERSAALRPTGTFVEFPSIASGKGKVVEVFAYERDGSIRWYGATSVDVQPGQTAFARVVLRKAAGSIHVEIVLEEIWNDTVYLPPQPYPDTARLQYDPVPRNALPLMHLSAYRTGGVVWAKVMVASRCGGHVRFTAHADPILVDVWPLPPGVVRLAATEDPWACGDSARRIDPVYPVGSLGRTTPQVTAAGRVAKTGLVAPSSTVYITTREVWISLMHYNASDVVLTSANPGDWYKIYLPGDTIVPPIDTLPIDSSSLTHCWYDSMGRYQCWFAPEDSVPSTCKRTGDGNWICPSVLPFDKKAI